MRYSNIDREIDKYGSVISVVVKSDVDYNKWGDQSSNSTVVSTNAIVNDVDGNEDFNKEGVFIPGDKVFFFKSTETDLDTDNTVTFDSVDYNITQIIGHKWGDSVQQFEVRCKRI